MSGLVSEQLALLLAQDVAELWLQPAPTLSPCAVFWAGVAGYVGLLAYLIVTPEGAQRAAAAVSRTVSRWSMRRASSSASSYSSLPGAPSAEAAGNGSIADVVPAGASKQPEAAPS